MNVDLPNTFNEFSEARRNGFIEIKELKENGKNIVGTYCAFTPSELIIAAEAIPISLCGMSEEPIADAEKHLPRNLCPLIKSSYGFAITDKCPYFYYSDMLIGETTCDGKKKMYEYLGKIKPMHIMQLPQTNSTEEAFLAWEHEMLLLKERLQKQFGVEITNEKLRSAIKLKNDERQALKNFYELSKLTPPPITGMELLNVLYGSGFKFDKKQQIKELNSLTEQIKKDYENGKCTVSSSKPRILITGCPLGGATEKIVKVIEENGGIVVAYENCSGIKSVDRLVAEDKEPLEALAEKYLNIGCSCLSPNKNRVDLLSRIVDEYKIDGVIDVILTACHTYNVETYGIKSFITEEKHKPYTAIETDYSTQDIGQLTTRISAFIEML